jgi:hypothetical protein
MWTKTGWEARTGVWGGVGIGECISFFGGAKRFLASFLLRGLRAGKHPFPAILEPSLVKT